MTEQEFERRILAMQDRMYRVSTTLLRQMCDREDAVQSAIEKAWRQQKKLRDDGAMQAWVMRILVNECYALLRKTKKEVPSDTLPERETAEDARPDIYRLFTGLDEKYRLIMVLHYVEGYQVQEIARMLRLPQGTVKSRLHRGRLKLREAMILEDDVL